MTKNQIIDLFYKNDKIISQRAQIKYLKKHNLYDILKNYYKDSESIQETLYRIKNNIDSRPICKMCGNHVTFRTGGFSVYCSKKCQNKDPEMLQKNKDGVSKSLKKLYIEKGNEIKEKRANTIKQHYGVKTCTPFGVKEIQNKIINTINQKYGVNNVFELPIFRRTREQMQQDSIEYQKMRGYNIEYTYDFNNKLKVKVCNGCKIHGDIYIDWSLFNNRTRESRRKYTILCPICNPIKNQETSIETIIKNLLLKHNINFIQHDRIQIKPYELDFYLPEYKIGIECNGSYWHSGYDNMIKHNNKLKLCENNKIKLIYYWSYQIYNNIHDVEIDLCNQLNIENNNLYNNPILLENNDITYYQYSLKNIDNITINTTKLAIPIDKDILNNIDNTMVNEIPFFVNYREEKLENNVNINILELQQKQNILIEQKGISICWTTKFNIYKIQNMNN